MFSKVPCDKGLMSTSMRPSFDIFEQNIPSRYLKIDFSAPFYSTKSKIDQSEQRCISLYYPKISSNRMPLFCLTKHEEELPVQRLSRVCRENMPTETSLWRLRWRSCPGTGMFRQLTGSAKGVSSTTGALTHLFRQLQGFQMDSPPVV